MNCKQGDWARVVAVTNPEALHCIGWIVLCTGPTSNLTDKPAWFTTPAAENKWGFFDKNLRPIGNPGEDAVDEMVRGVSCARTRTVEVA